MILMTFRTTTISVRIFVSEPGSWVTTAGAEKTEKVVLILASISIGAV